jgi:nucleoside-diphosphate-sugar epimerase
VARVLITGGSGFIGTNLVDHYLRLGHNVRAIDVVAPRQPAHLPNFRAIDVRDAHALQRAVIEYEPELVFHLGARTDLRGRVLADYAGNIEGVTNMVRAVNELPNLRLAVFASSMLVCRLGYVPQREDDYCPTTAYGQSKAEGETIVRQLAAAHLPWVIVRPTSIWGPWFGPPYRDLFDAIQRGIYAQPRGLRVRRSYGFVFNSVHQLHELGRCGGGALLGRTVYLADGQPTELMEWVRLIQAALGRRRVRELPMSLFASAARIGDALEALGIQRFPMSTRRLQNMLTEAIYDTQPIHSVAGPDPYSLPAAVMLTCDWLTRQRAAA